MPTRFTCAALFSLVTAVAFMVTLVAAEHDQQEARPQGPTRHVPGEFGLYEWRALQAGPGKLEALHARLRDRQIPLLERHGIVTQGVFVPAGGNPDRRVYLLLAAEGPGPMQDGWSGLRNDPEWLEAVARTEGDATEKLVEHEGCQRLVKTHWSPRFTPTVSAEPRVFELRTYTCPDHAKQVALWSAC